MISRDTFLRRVLLADAALSGLTGALMAGGSGLLAGLLALPEPLLRYAGLVLLPFAAFVAFVATRPAIPRGGAWAVVLINGLWSLESVAMLVMGWVAPNLLGSGFVLFQAAAVAGLAVLQFYGLRRFPSAA